MLPLKFCLTSKQYGAQLNRNSTLRNYDVCTYFYVDILCAFRNNGRNTASHYSPASTREAIEPAVVFGVSGGVPQTKSTALSPRLLRGLSGETGGDTERQTERPVPQLPQACPSPRRERVQPALCLLHPTPFRNEGGLGEGV